MKFLLLLSLVTFGCEMRDESQTTAELKHQIEKTDSQDTTQQEDWRYAKYKSSLEGYKDTFLAVRVLIEDNKAKRLELKDLTEGREARAVETADLTGANNTDNTAYKFSGTSSLQDADGGVDYGGKYTGSLKLNTDGMVADDGCCGEMTFKPTIGQQTDEDLTFTVTKVEEKFGKKEWDDAVALPTPSVLPVTTCEDFKLVISEISDVKRWEEINYTISLQNCAGDPVTNAAGTKVKLQYTHADKNGWTDSVHDGKELTTAGSHSYTYKIRAGINNKLWTDFKYKASIEFDHDSEASTAPKTYTVESNTFVLSPATDVVGSCADDNYSIEVIKTKPTDDVKIDELYTLKVTLKCDGEVVSDRAVDNAQMLP